MTNRYTGRHGATSWLLGFVVLVAVGIAVTWMLYDGSRKANESEGVAGQVADQGQSGELPKLMTAARSAAAEGVPVRGTVLLPDGVPAASATVTLYRLITAAPEWRKEHVVQAITGDDGVFQFRCPHLYGYLLGFEHPDYAGGEVQVSVFGDAMRLQLKPGFSISGTVLNDLGAPVPRTRVSVESVLGDNRRAKHTYTAADGSYSFHNLAAGLAQMVARHEFWQPARVSAVAIGVRPRTDFQFSRPSMSPLRGRVLLAATQLPVAGATVELKPIDSKLGLVDPVSTMTAKDGTFLLSGLSRGGANIVVRHADHGSVLETVSIRSVAKDITVELPGRAPVAGSVDGVFSGGEVLEAKDLAGELAYATVQEDGSFQFAKKLTPGYVDFRSVDGAFLFRNLLGTSVGMRVDEADDDEPAEIELATKKTSLVRGRLEDADGNPVGGARIESVAESGLPQIGAGTWNLDLLKASEGFFKLASGQGVLLAVSDEDGRFEIRGHRRGTMQAKVSCAGYGTRMVEVTIPASGQIHEMANTVLEPSCTVSGRVMRGGQPFVGASVTLTSEHSGSSATTNERGEFFVSDLMPGRYDVLARVVGRPTGGAGARSVDAHPDRPVTDLILPLKTGRIVKGTVTDERMRPLVGALVSVRGRAGEVIATRASGEFELELPTRDVELLVSFGDRSSQKVHTVPSDQQIVELSLAIPETCTLTARVAGLPGRRPLAGVMLRLTELGVPDAQTKSRWVETSGGELRHSHVPSGRVMVEIWSEGHAPYQREWRLKTGEVHDLGEVFLAPGAKLRGVVRDVEGEPVDGAMILLGEETDFAFFAPKTRSDADGTFTIHGVTSRSKRMVVRSPGFAANAITLQLPRDVLSLDPFEVELVRGATIEVSVSGSMIPEEGLVYLRRDGHVLESTLLDDEGKAWFANRSAGRYVVQLLGDELSEQVVIVKPDQEVAFARFLERRK